MLDSNQPYEKDNINLWIDPDRKARWEKCEFQYLSQPIWRAVEREISCNEPGGESLDRSEEIASPFDDLHALDRPPMHSWLDRELVRAINGSFRDQLAAIRHSASPESFNGESPPNHVAVHCSIPTMRLNP